jgi:hypothetical protein
MSKPSPAAEALDRFTETAPEAPRSATRIRAADKEADALDRLMELATMLDPEDWLAKLSAQSRG